MRTYGNYSKRIFYFIITNHKNGKIDEAGTWDTKEEDNGKYKVTVFATDLNGNITIKTIDVIVNN